MASFLDKDGLEYLWNKIKPWIPKKTSDIQNDSGFISTETDPTVPAWAKEATKPSYTAAEVGASEAGHTHDDRYYTESEMDARFSGLIDIFYPVGSYYETSDTSFNPNTAWGGTWSLESEGQVHISAGSNYAAGSSYGSNSKNHTPEGSVGGTTLTAAQSGVPAHSHGNTIKATTPKFVHSITQPAFNTPKLTHSITQPAFTGPSHHHASVKAVSAKLGSGTLGARIYAQSGTTGDVWNTSDSGTGACTRTTNVAITDHAETACTRSTNVEISDHAATACTMSGSVSDNTAADATKSHNHTFTGTQASINVMQDSVAVNRWHRTA